MAEPSFVQIFGTGVVRLASGATTPSAGLFIPDSALQIAGLTTPTTASAEGHLVAINLNAKSYLSESNFDANIDQSIYLEDGSPGFTTRGTDNTRYRTDQISMILSKVDTGATINPSSY